VTVASDIVVEISSYQAPALTKTRPTRHRFTWTDLSERFLKHRRSETKNVAGWSPAIYQEGHTRGNDYVISVSCAVGDFDHCTNDDLLAVKDRLAELGLAYVLYSTYSCTPDELAFRVVIPFTESVGKDEWNDVWHRCNAHLFGGKNDKQTKDQSRFFYVPSAPPDALVFAERHDGSTLDIASLPPAPYGVADEHEPLDHDLIINGIPEGERDWTLYRMACDMRGKGVPIEYALLTIVEAARRCSPPFDESEAEKKVVQAYRQFQPNPVITLNGHVQPSELQGTATPFPVDALPEAFQRYIERVARLKVCPPEYIAIPLLVSAGTAIGNVAKIRLNATWSEGPNLFAALIGDPGAKKTPAIQQAMRPLTRLQRTLSKQYEKEAEQHKREMAHWESLPKKERGPEPSKPTYKHVVVNDVTIEKLAEVMAAAKGVALSHDELAAWVRAMDQYRGGKGSDRQHYLSMWSGTAIKVDRKSSPVPIVVESPCLGVVGGIQPEMLTELADTRGRNDGFLDRLLWSYPDPIEDRWVPDDGESDNIDELDEMFTALYACYGTSDLVGHHVPLEVRLSPEASAVWAFWYTDHASDRNLGNLPQNLAGPWAKMGSQLARITLILHMIESSTNIVSADTLGRAIRIVEYFKDHARRVFAELSESRGGADLKILETLKREGELSQKNIRRKVFHDHMTGDKVRGLLMELEERGLVAQRTEETAGRPAIMWSLA
jgi:hypothetical protein